MAKLSMVEREKRRLKFSARDRLSREKLKKIIKSLNVSNEEKKLAVDRLSKKKRDGSSCRIARRCRSCGRPRAVYRKFGLCRICLRKTAMLGYVPGLVKASW